MDKPFWNRYRVEIVVNRLVEGIPGSEKTMSAWLDKHEVKDEAREAQLAVLERVDVEELHSVIFWRDADGKPYYEGRCFKAALKEAANVLKTMLDKKAWRSKLAERVFVEEQVVPITTEVRSESRPISVMTMQGPRTSLKSYEYAENVPLTFHLKVLGDDVFKEADIRLLLDYMQENGLGADRSQGAGTFSVVDFQQLSDYRPDMSLPTS